MGDGVELEDETAGPGADQNRSYPIGWTLPPS